MRLIKLLAPLLALSSALHADPLPGWQDYHIVMWQPHAAPALRAMQSIGIDGAMVYAKSGVINPQDVNTAQQVGDLFYLENIVTDIFSPYHFASSDAKFKVLQDAHQRDPSDRSVFERTPSLADPDTRQRVRQRLEQVGAQMKATPPLFYSIADEPGIASTGWAWDFDISPAGLAGFRSWLRGQYPTLDALNAQWGSAYASFDQAVPMLTDEAVRRGDGNFSAWGDFKQWSDDGFAAAIREGSDALHRADPAGIAAIEGVQIPGWGGYDFARLANTVDLIEFYEYGHNIEIAQSVNPKLIAITTSFGTAPGELNRLWHEVLLGARGHVIWDEHNDFADADGRLGESSRAAAASYLGLRGGVPTQIINSQRPPAQVAILASMPSYRIEWLLARKAENRDWSRRNIDDDYLETPWRRATDRAALGLAHLGVPASYLSPEMLEGGVAEGIRLLVLPKTLAMSDREAAAVRAFLARGGVVISDGTPGLYDHHLRQRPQPVLADVARELIDAAFLQSADPQSVAADLAPRLARAGIALPFTLSTPDGTPLRDAQAQIWRNGAVTLIALQRDAPNKIAASLPESVVVTLPNAAHATDLLQHRALGQNSRFTLTLDPVKPSFLALSATEMPNIVVRAVRQSPGRIQLELDAGSHPALVQVVHVELLDAAGNLLAMHNLGLHGGLSADEFATPEGAVRLRIVDVLSGAVVDKSL